MIAIGAVLGFFTWLRAVRPDGFQPTKRVIPVGSVFTVKVQHALTSDTERVGDAFRAAVVSVETADGAAVPVEGWVTGKCVAARGKEGPGRPGYLRLSLSDYRDFRGHTASLVTSAVSLWGRAASRQKSDALARPITNSAALQAEMRASEAEQAVITPETPISFVLLDPAVVSRWGERR
jgi:hypothetical protein